MPKLFVASLMFIFVSSCHHFDNRGLNQILEKAGDNKEELIKVINHYSGKGDSLKLKAAYFLIENIDGMKMLDTNSVKSNAVYFDYLNTIKTPVYKTFSIASKGIDSINASLKEAPIFPQEKYVDELLNVSSDFLIRNIDSAFYVWKNMAWAKNVSFDDFCEYILPYHCTNTYAPNVRDFFLDKYRHLPDSIRSLSNMVKVGQYIINDVNSWFAEDVYFLPKYPYLKPMKFSDLLKGKIGPCYDANTVRVAALRAMGVATAFDQIPNWGNDHLPHFWYKIIDKNSDAIKSKIQNINEDIITQHIISASSFDVPFFEGTPSNIQVNFIRTVPKVYRRCFSKQKNSLAYIAATEEIPPFFQNIRLKDVTNEYVETANVSLALENNGRNYKFAYLCVFDNQKWVPVAWSGFKNGSTEFKEIGKNIVYLPAYYEDGEIIPAGNPFLFNAKGQVEKIEADQKNETVKLYTKFPFKSYELLWESYMLGNRFQLANKPDLSDSVTVHTITKLPFHETEVSVTVNKKYRYLIYQFGRPKDSWGDGWTSELQFYTLNKNGEEVKLNGTSIGNGGEYPNLAEKLFDGIPYNVYKPDMSLRERYVGLDLGEGNASRVTKVSFIPFTDDNVVRAGDTYELFYWKTDYWESCGISKANGVKYVIFEKVPANALLLLKNIKGGIQQRIFTYQNNKQVFW
jgi:hypothetical protein